MINRKALWLLRFSIEKPQYIFVARFPKFYFAFYLFLYAYFSRVSQGSVDPWFYFIIIRVSGTTSLQSLRLHASGELVMAAASHHPLWLAFCLRTSIPGGILVSIYISEQRAGMRTFGGPLTQLGRRFTAIYYFRRTDVDLLLSWPFERCHQRNLTLGRYFSCQAASAFSPYFGKLCHSFEADRAVNWMLGSRALYFLWSKGPDRQHLCGKGTLLRWNVCFAPISDNVESDSKITSPTRKQRELAVRVVANVGGSQFAESGTSTRLRDLCMTYSRRKILSSRQFCKQSWKRSWKES